MACRAAFVALVSILLGACSGATPTPIVIYATPTSTPVSDATPAATATPQPTPTPTATPTPTPEPTPVPSPIPPLSREAAGRRYLTFATKANADFEALDAKYTNADGSFRSLEALKTYHRIAAVLDRRFADNIRKTRWPAEYAADFKLLLRRLAEEEVADLQAAAATSWIDAYQLQAAANRASTTRAGVANLVRADLGLPSVPIK